MPSALAHRGFRFLWFGAVLSYLSQWIQQVALAWVGYELTGSTLVLGLILGVRAIPMLALAPFSGVAAERYDRRNLLLACQLLFGVSAAALAIALATGAATPVHLIVFVFIAGIAGVFDRNARQAIILDLVPRELAISAVSLVSVAMSVARTVAPAIAGVLIAVAGSAWNFALQAFAYMISALCLLAIKIPKRRSSIAGLSARQAMRAGLALAYRDRTLRVLLITGALPYVFVFGSWTVLFPVIVRDSFAAGPETLGFMFAAMGTGGVCGGLLGPWLARWDRIGVVQTLALLAMGLALIGIALSPNVFVALPFAFVAGLGDMLNSSTNQTLVQLATPADYRGRVTGLFAVFPAFIALGSLWSGAFGAATGAVTAMCLIGGFAVLLALGTFVFAPRLARLRMSQLRQ